ncbi:MAG TPA: hypothetical protein VG034_17665 [Acidimicrobiia bacterium]|jgi:hypothetical protein|nr:hypothetical protein [Acidimicrobiia bacterium]
MHRSIAVLAGLALAIFLGPAPAAEAFGAGACTIGGTITFTPSGQTPGQGTWDISPGVIQCRGQFNTYEYMLRHGSFSGSGTYTSLPSTEGTCLKELGTGTVDYWIPTDKQDIHTVEPYAFLLAGAGAFTTPTLRGVFQVTTFDHNCVTGPGTKASFLAQVTLFRGSLADWTL